MSIAITLAAIAALSPQSSPTVVLNEVMFDPIGAPTSDGAWQWVEIMVKSPTTFDSSWSLADSQGTTLFTFPSVLAPTRSYVMVFLGPSAPIEQNLNSAAGPLVMSSGHAFGDHLGVNGGGVRLVHQGSIVDQVYWRASFGQPHLPLTHASGMVLDEGDSIGRNGASLYTGSASDWTIAGGANSNGITPSAANLVELPVRRDLVAFQDTQLNSVISSLSMCDGGAGWLSVTDSRPVVSSFDNSYASGDTVTIDVVHELDIEVDGVLHTLSGTVGTLFTCDRTAPDFEEKFDPQV